MIQHIYNNFQIIKISIELSLYWSNIFEALLEVEHLMHNFFLLFSKPIIIIKIWALL